MGKLLIPNPHIIPEQAAACFEFNAVRSRNHEATNVNWADGVKGIWSVDDLQDN